MAPRNHISAGSQAVLGLETGIRRAEPQLGADQGLIGYCHFIFLFTFYSCASILLSVTKQKAQRLQPSDKNPTGPSR